MEIKNHTFEETHCDRCGGLNNDKTNWTCPDCITKVEKLEEKWNDLDMERDHITGQMQSIKEEIKDASQEVRG